MSMGLKKCCPASCSVRCLKAACALAMRPIHPAAFPFGNEGGTWQAAGTSERFLPENWCPNLSDLRSSLPWKKPGPQRNIDATCHESGGFFVKWPQHPSRSSPKLAPALGSRHVAKLPWASTWLYDCWNLRALTDNTLGVQQPTRKPNSFQK